MKRPGFLKRLRVDRRTVGPDATAGLVLGVQSVPDGLASGVLAGINPLYGLYGIMLGKPVGAIFSSSAYMSIQTTSAMALVIASVPVITPASRGTLFTLTLMTGALMLVAGILKLGRLMRFVPNSEMVGFMQGVGVLLILSQLGDLTGYVSTHSNKVARALDLLFHLPQVDLPTLAVGITTIILILVLEKTRLRALGMVVAIIIGSILPFLFRWGTVLQVSDIAQITRGLPLPTLPDLHSVLDLVLPALSLTVIGLIQGAGVSQSYVNPDGNYPNVSRDFVGHGAANLAAGVFQGMPIGGSVSATALVVSSGARTRFANIFAGIVLAIITLVFSGAVGRLAMPALAGLLIIIGFRILDPAKVMAVWRTGLIQKVVMVVTFALVLTVPLQYAVLIGVGLSVILFAVRQSNQVTVKEWKIQEGGLPVEQAPPRTIPARTVTVLMPYGSLFYASSPVLEEQLPDVDQNTDHAVVIFNLRGRDDLGSTFMKMIERYGQDLRRHDSRLWLAEVEPSVREQLARAGMVTSVSRRRIFLSTERVWESLYDAYAAALEWVSPETDVEAPPEAEGSPGSP